MWLIPGSALDGQSAVRVHSLTGSASGVWSFCVLLVGGTGALYALPSRSSFIMTKISTRGAQKLDLPPNLEKLGEAPRHAHCLLPLGSYVKHLCYSH